ncbi:21753_t:CDS:10 [Rhizophagus irregularis]|nr:21753_t:CDS:10 [Rhizophagus irregularis]
MANECSNSENLFPAYNQHENLQEENQDIQRINLELNEKNQEISRNNLELNKKYYQEISRNNSNLIKENEKILRLDVRVIVGLDFGVTYSGFAYCHVNDDYQDIHTNDIWPMVAGRFKTNTVLQYDDEFNNVKQNSEPVKLFKLYLGDLSDNLKPKLPIDYKKAITDYLREIGMVIKGLLNAVGVELTTLKMYYRDSEKLQFTTESKATALYCVKHCFKQTFMFVDCGKYTTDLTIRKLDRNNPLHIDKVTTYNKDFCGSKLINEEFIKFLRERLGTCAIDLLKENNYNKLQYMYVSEETREIMEYNELIINIKYDDIKKMFDTLIDRIIRLIHIQLLNDKENCSAIFLTGDFCVNKYLQNRIKEEFSHQVNNISVPVHPEAVISRGAVIYGLSIISSKTLVERDTKITPEQTFSFNFEPESNQARGSFAIYYTRKYNIEYCDELGTKLLGILNIDLLDSVHLDNGSINFELTFGQYEIIASARNENGQEHMTTFCYPADYDF